MKDTNSLGAIWKLEESWRGRPCYPPLASSEESRLPPVPALWERARAFFARLIEHIGSAGKLAPLHVIRRTHKREVMNLLLPAEKLVRVCLIVKAATFLLMTPEGRRLLRETPKQAPPEPRCDLFQKKQPHSIAIPYPGWNTIAKLWRPEPPKPPEPPPKDMSDPSRWSCRFRVLGWNRSADNDPDGEAALRPLRRAITADHLLIVGDAETTGFRSLLRQRQHDKPGLILARRIEALARVIENPQRAIRRAARFLAALPREILAGMHGAAHSRYWTHGRLELLQANLHLLCARTILARPIDPG